MQNLFGGAGWPEEHPGAPGRGSYQGGLQPTAHGPGQLGQGQPGRAAADPEKEQTHTPFTCEYRPMQSQHGALILLRQPTLLATGDATKGGCSVSSRLLWVSQIRHAFFYGSFFSVLFWL